MFQNAARRAGCQAAALRSALEQRLPVVLVGWIVAAAVASALRIAMSPSTSIDAPLAALFPYLLLVAAPAVSLTLALRWFDGDPGQAVPTVRSAWFGVWRPVDRTVARRHRLYGADGLMVSLLVGMLLNVPLRALEYLAAMPALAGPMPEWLAVLRTMMTLDVVLVSTLYVIAFAAALRLSPAFPRLLVSVWLVDLAFQGLTARLVAAEPGLPARVASALESLLVGNAWKVIASMAIWLPYLLLSKRVNVTYRHRISA
jgi:hypothetical protein